MDASVRNLNSGVWSKLPEPKTYNIFDPKILANPYPLYRELQAEQPIYWDEKYQILVISRYDDVLAALKDPRLSVERVPAMIDRLPVDERQNFGELKRWFSLFFLNQDPPRHTRLRGLVAKAFSPRLMEAMRPRIATIAQELIVNMRSQGQGDLLVDFAFPLPLFVIGDLIGVPHSDWKQLKQWSVDFSRFLTPMPSVADCQLTQNSAAHFGDYFKGIIAERRKKPQQDLISQLVQVEENGDVLSEEEMLATLMLLIIAGHETTSNLIGNGVYTLLTQTEQLAFFRNNLFQAPAVVEEVLRFESPVHYTSRIARAPGFEIGGYHLPAGKRALLFLASAHRDPSVFENPNKFDPLRDNRKQIAFGQGIHFCPGTPLARLEGQIALPALFEAFPLLRLDETATLEWNAGSLRGLKKLPVRWHREP